MFAMNSKESDLNFGKVITYFAGAMTADSFDLAIRPVPNDADGSHGTVELLFLQDKGSNQRTDVVAAIRMQAYQLKELYDLIGRKLNVVDAS